MALRGRFSKGQSLGNYTHNSSAGPDFLNLCQQAMLVIQALVNGGNHLMNERQCRDLLAKLARTVYSTQELVFHCGGSSNLFLPALKNLYRILEKARLLVNRCSTDDWITEAVFQIENAIDFQVILLEAGLCYHAIYEQAKDNMSGKWSFQHLDPGSSTFWPTPVSDIHNDQVALKQRLEGLVSSGPRQSLARYLLATWECISRTSDEFNLSRAIMCMKEIESSETWGKGDYLGHGSCGGVCSATWLGIPCAKKIFDGEVNESLFLKEAGILLHLNHPNVVRFFCCDNGHEGGACYIAMELMEMSLAKLISIQSKRHTLFSLPVAIEIIVQIARAMCYLHGMGVVHRDLKPQNVVVNRLTSPHLEDHYCVKLVDFGMSKVKVEVSKSNIVTSPGIGTTKYRAPEVHPKAHPDGHGKVNWFKADVYSFGVTCAHLLSLKEPFENMHLGNKYAELMDGLKPEVPTTYPEKLVVLLNDCWSARPSSRPRFPEICMKLEEVRHEFLRGFSPPDQGFKQFIQIEVENHFAMIRRQHVARTDDIDLKPTLKSMDGRASHLDMVMSDISSAVNVLDLQTTAFGESLPSTNKANDKDELAYTLERSVLHQSAQSEAMISQSRRNFSKGSEPEIEFSKAQYCTETLEQQSGIWRLPKIWYKKIKSLAAKDKEKKRMLGSNGDLADYLEHQFAEDSHVAAGLDPTSSCGGSAGPGEWNASNIPTMSINARGDSPELRKIMQETPRSRAAGSQSDRSNWASKEKLRIRDQSKSLRLESFPEEELRSLLWAQAD